VKRALASILIPSAILVASATLAADPLPTWDGLVLVPSKRLDLVYLQPGADFGGYTKVMIEPTEVAFAKDWQRDYNRGALGLSSRVSDSDIERALSEAVIAASDLFAEAWTKGGYTVVQTPGPDVMQVKTGLLNVRVTAPDTRSAGRTHSFANEAGSATFFVEVRDSMSGALLGRAVDQRLVGDNMSTWRTRVSNRSDFRQEVERWAEISVRGIAELKALSPINP
jgi:hypothetical protein